MTSRTVSVVVFSIFGIRCCFSSLAFAFLDDDGGGWEVGTSRWKRCSRRRWSLRSMCEANDRQQWRQRKGSSPVCVRRWCFRPMGTLKTVSHSGQTRFLGLPSSSICHLKKSTSINCGQLLSLQTAMKEIISIKFFSLFRYLFKLFKVGFKLPSMAQIDCLLSLKLKDDKIKTIW